ncbi:MAG TPA: hypothetical protein VEZ12_20455, partial [Herpetosiphonaceae bacterium]|nr:hypothetical protein [Herpetosiphonaceae bacterium]
SITMRSTQQVSFRLVVCVCYAGGAQEPEIARFKLAITSARRLIVVDMVRLAPARRSWYALPMDQPLALVQRNRGKMVRG